MVAGISYHTITEIKNAGADPGFFKGILWIYRAGLLKLGQAIWSML